MSTELSAAATRWRMERNLARSAALLEAERKIETVRTELQRRIYAEIMSGRSIADISRETGLGRSTIYKWRDEHEKVAQFFEEPEAPTGWKITHAMSGEFLAEHPSEGAIMCAMGDGDDGPILWAADGRYRPVYQGTSAWTSMHDTILAAFEPLYNAWVAAGSQMMWEPDTE